MKSLLKSLAVFALLALLVNPQPVKAQDDSGNDDDVSFQTFYDQLGDQGTWIQTDDYGYVWQPPVQDPNWTPYSDGQWVYTDDGWTWESNEPWGWATYHYGRWANIDDVGWVWVPGYRWAPAWVSWRYGGGYCGWAPLPPETIYGAEYGEPGIQASAIFHFGGDVDVSFNIGAGCYNFIPVGDMGNPNCNRYIVNRHNNYGIINNTTNVTNVNVYRNGRGFRGVMAGGPPINDINVHSRQPVQRLHLAERNQPGRNSIENGVFNVYAPRINPTTAQNARPSRVSQTINQPKFNRGDSIQQPMRVAPNIAPNEASPEAISAAQRAQAQAPAKAKIATVNTPPRNFNQPFNSLQPFGQPSRHGTNPGGQPGNPEGNSNVKNQGQSNGFNPANQNRVQSESPQSSHVVNGSGKGFQPQPYAPQPNDHLQTFYPQPQGNENRNGNGVPQPQTQAPTQTFHPQPQRNENRNGNDAPQPQTQAPTQTFHPQSQGFNHPQSNHPQPPPSATPSQSQPAQPANHPQPSHNSGSGQGQPPRGGPGTGQGGAGNPHQ